LKPLEAPPFHQTLLAYDWSYLYVLYDHHAGHKRAVTSGASVWLANFIPFFAALWSWRPFTHRAPGNCAGRPLEPRRPSGTRPPGVRALPAYNALVGNVSLIENGVWARSPKRLAGVSWLETMLRAIKYESRFIFYGAVKLTIGRTREPPIFARGSRRPRRVLEARTMTHPETCMISLSQTDYIG